MAQGECGQAEQDGHAALALGLQTGSQLRIPEALEVLALVACSEHNNRHAVRLFAAADASRTTMGGVRFPVYSTGVDSALKAAREDLGDTDFDAAWVEGAAMSTEDAIAYAQRGRGERRRPPIGWGSLTPTEHQVVGLVSEGLGNKDIAERMFISPRTVQTHLTHVYAKLGLESRIQLVQEAARHA
jgi:DNA-binding CsgD family transcriptional regulator